MKQGKKEIQKKAIEDSILRSLSEMDQKSKAQWENLLHFSDGATLRVKSFFNKDGEAVIFKREIKERAFPFSFRGLVTHYNAGSFLLERKQLK